MTKIWNDKQNLKQNVLPNDTIKIFIDTVLLRQSWVVDCIFLWQLYLIGQNKSSIQPKFGGYDWLA